MKKRILVCGAGGFIGGHMVCRLKNEGNWVRGVDIKNHEYKEVECDEFFLGDLRDRKFVHQIFDGKIDEVYQFAADMGGAGYIFTGEHDADVMHNSATINLNILDECIKRKIKKIFYSSSACVYPEHSQMDPLTPDCREEAVYPANPDSDYGWEKLFSERLYMAYKRNYGIGVHIARYHNIFGPFGAWNNGKEKSPAAICRKIIENDKEIEIWGDGEQTRSFLYIDECIEATRRLMDSDFFEPINIGSEEMISINNLANMAMKFENKKLNVVHINGPQGVRGRRSFNDLMRNKLKWEPTKKLEDGLRETYFWIKSETEKI